MTFEDLVRAELTRARAKHPKPINSAHEGYAVLSEEMFEVWDEVRARKLDRTRLLAEVVQVGCVAQRLAEDLGLLACAEQQANELPGAHAAAVMAGVSGVCSGHAEYVRGIVTKALEGQGKNG